MPTSAKRLYRGRMGLGLEIPVKTGIRRSASKQSPGCARLGVEEGRLTRRAHLSVTRGAGSACQPKKRGGEGQRASVPGPRSGPRRGGRGGVLGRKRELGCGEKKGKPGLRAEREKGEGFPFFFSFVFFLFLFIPKLFSHHFKTF
jgi:hypothetical protein